MREALGKITSRVPLELLDVAVVSREKIRELYRSGKLPTAEMLVEEILLRSVNTGATDIHIEPGDTDLRIRIRVDGALEQLVSLPKDIAENIVGVLKARAGLSAFEKKKVLEGRFSLLYETLNFDVRFTIVPLITGERVAVRLLKKDAPAPNLSELNISSVNDFRLGWLLGRHSGLILAAGGPGSGKTTTLSAGLQSIPAGGRNIMTVEDPVVYRLQGVSQSSIAQDRTMTYADAVRAVLRQKPDVLMVGELRDAKTALAAAEAAVNGCLVMSSILANDSVGAIHRLLHMGVPAYWVAQGLNGVVYQRLLRRICDACSQEYVPQDLPRALAELNPEAVRYFRGVGCPECKQTGYRGRIAVHEVLVVTDSMRELINQNGQTAPASKFRPALDEIGFNDAMFDAAMKTAAGLTSVEEFRTHFG